MSKSIHEVVEKCGSTDNKAEHLSRCAHNTNYIFHSDKNIEINKQTITAYLYRHIVMKHIDTGEYCVENIIHNTNCMLVLALGMHRKVRGEI